MNTDIKILECTLRDGSYHVDFKFTSRDTMILASALEIAGFTHIEVGHGLGLNAQNAGKGLAAAPDEEYLRAVSKTLGTASWGTFFIPGIGREDDLRMAADHSMGFVRVGTNVTEVETSQKAIALSKKLGFQVFSNLMKSYALPPEEVAVRAAQARDYGTDVVYLVDSAGTMLPEDVARYIDAMREAVDIPLGLHCHDNLGLSLANVIKAMEHGAVYLDSTLQGMGRGGGNPSTEALVAILHKLGLADGLDIQLIQDLGERFIKPMLGGRSWDALDIMAGISGFHSGYLGRVLEYSGEHGLNPRDLILELGKINQVAVTEENLATARRNLASAGTEAGVRPRCPNPIRALDPPFGRSTDPAEAVADLARRIQAAARKGGKAAVLNLVAAWRPAERPVVSHFVQEEFNFTIGGVEVTSPDHVETILDNVDGLVDYVLVDTSPRLDTLLDMEGVARSRLSRSQVLTYVDDEVWVRAVALQLETYFDSLAGRLIVLQRPDSLGLALAEALLHRQARILVLHPDADARRAMETAHQGRARSGRTIRFQPPSREALEACEACVAFDGQAEFLDALNQGSVLLDFRIGSIDSRSLEQALARGVVVLRPDMRAALAAELSALLDTRRLVREIMGRGELGSVPVVAGGMIGRRGDVVVDSLSRPTRVVGVADGAGFLLAGENKEYTDLVHRVEEAIISNLTSRSRASG